MSKYTRLTFELKHYGADDESLKKLVRFEGHRGWQQIQFSGEKPTPRELELVTELSRILDELAGETPETQDSAAND